MLTYNLGHNWMIAFTYANIIVEKFNIFLTIENIKNDYWLLFIKGP